MLPGERRRLKGTQDLVNSAPETGILWLPLTFRGPLCKTHVGEAREGSVGTLCSAFQCP